MTLYTTGKFAKKANVTERTLRYYDKIGLLKPTNVGENGYRQYSDKDFLKLQKILSLRKLGFSIEEIFPLVVGDSDIVKSLNIQVDLLDQRIRQFQVLKSALKSISEKIEKNHFDWKEIIELVHLTNAEEQIVEQYKNTFNLNVRIALHEKYSTNTEGWFPWLYRHIDFCNVYRMLEVGCGNGALWRNNTVNLRNREIFLSDVSEGMVEEVRKSLGKDFNCIVADCCRIPFKDRYFDAVIANHMLFYLNNPRDGLEEISRVLRANGTLYCTTYGEKHLQEIRNLVKEFDENIELSQNHLYDKFGLENGEEMLEKHFSQVEKIEYPDSLMIDRIEPLVHYILSCHGNQNEYLGRKIDEFRKFIAEKMEEKGYLEISKQAVLFICKK